MPVPNVTSAAEPRDTAWASLRTNWLRGVLVAVAAVFFALHFLHLKADFPNYSPWTDWSKYTDEGWYGDAAIRHTLFGHWYLKGDFNPAVALPMWPALELILFHFTGASVVAARSLTLVVFALTLIGAWFLLERHTGPRAGNPFPPLAAALAVLLLCVSPFFYVFERMAILEPLMICLTVLALITASHLHPLTHHEPGPVDFRSRLRDWLPSLALGLLLPALVLTKTTAVALFPAVFYMLWARAGYRLRTAVRFAIVPLAMTAAVWIVYYVFFVRRYLEDYQYLFSANAYTGIELEPFANVIVNTVSDGMWMGHVVYPVFFAVLALALFWRPRLFRNPLVPALLLWIGGYFAFLAYHNNLQPRYYLVVAMPITLMVALGIDCFRAVRGRSAMLMTATAAAAVTLAIAIPDAVQTIGFVRHPEYTFLNAANRIREIVQADKSHSNLVLSISGSDITLMTGLPSIDDDFGTLDLDQRVAQYHPGWYAAWNQVDDDKMDALQTLYRLERVASFPAMDDSDRDLLILYRLDPKERTPAPPRRRKPTPKPLVTKVGQQPTTQQLEH